MRLAAFLALCAAVAVAQPVPRPGGEPVAARVEAAGFPAGLALGALGAVAVSVDHPRFGGLSGVVVTPDGSRFTAVSDRGTLVTGRLDREEGRLSGVSDLRLYALRGADGRERPFAADDAEALALAPDGALLIAFEGDDPRIERHAAPGAAAQRVDEAPGFAALQRNSGLEALAVGPEGSVYAIPERSGALDRPFPVFRRDAAGWSVGAFPREPPHLVTGADVGPDGRLYVLERDFAGFGGFAVRVRRAELADWPDLRPEAVFASRGLDNLEAISLWRDPDGRLRLLMVADDNFSPLQRTLFVEVAVE